MCVKKPRKLKDWRKQGGIGERIEGRERERARELRAEN